jgi:uncharacterized iron-regulated membrane protein
MIWAILGLTPGLLFVTGLITWWRPRPRKPAAAVQEDLMLAGSSKIASQERYTGHPSALRIQAHLV